MSIKKTITPASPRDMWLTIALAVARDGMPEPHSFQLRPETPHGPCVTMQWRNNGSHAAAHRWAEWADALKSETRHQHDELGISTVSYWNVSGPLGWFWEVDGRESIKAAPDDLADQVAAAIACAGGEA